MGRPSDKNKYIRVELRFLRAQPGPAYAELLEEATLRGVSLSEHIHELLQHRFNARHGMPYIETLWVPTQPSTAATPPSPPPNEDPAPAGGRAAAKAWLRRKG